MTILARAFSRKFAPDEIAILVQQALQDILKTVSPQSVILFGSAVSDRFDEASDLDILVVFRDAAQAAAGQKALYRMKRTVPRPHDFICVDEATFRAKSEIGGVLFVARQEGKVLYSADDSKIILDRRSGD